MEFWTCIVCTLSTRSSRFGISWRSKSNETNFYSLKLFILFNSEPWKIDRCIRNNCAKCSCRPYYASSYDWFSGQKVGTICKTNIFSSVFADTLLSMCISYYNNSWSNTFRNGNICVLWLINNSRDLKFLRRWSRKSIHQISVFIFD